MNDDEFHARLKELYHPPKNQFSRIKVPPIRYMVIEGEGDPQQNGIDTAMQWLWSITYFLLPIAKKALGKNLSYPPPECLFWAEDVKDFIAGNKDQWRWKVMTVLGSFFTEEQFYTAVNKAEEKRGEKAPKHLGIEQLEEGECVQYLHVGDYSKVGEICRTLYQDYLPQQGLQANGRYHEIYLNDPNRTASENRKIVIRQPIQ